MNPQRYVALLRGINVGRDKRVSMADLKTLVIGQGFDNVRTLLNSGNVLFDGPAGEPGEVGGRIQDAIGSTCGFSCRVMVATAEELAEIVGGNEIEHLCADPSRFLVAVSESVEVVHELAPVAGQEWHPEALALGTRAAYLWCADGILASPLLRAVDKIAGERVTTRNWSTMLKLHQLANERPGWR